MAAGAVGAAVRGGQGGPCQSRARATPRRRAASRPRRAWWEGGPAAPGRLPGRARAWRRGRQRRGARGRGRTAGRQSHAGRRRAQRRPRAGGSHGGGARRWREWRGWARGAGRVGWRWGTWGCAGRAGAGRARGRRGRRGRPGRPPPAAARRGCGRRGGVSGCDGMGPISIRHGGQRGAMHAGAAWQAHPRVSTTACADGSCLPIARASWVKGERMLGPENLGSEGRAGPVTRHLGGRREPAGACPRLMTLPVSSSWYRSSKRGGSAPPWPRPPASRDPGRDRSPALAARRCGPERRPPASKLVLSKCGCRIAHEEGSRRRGAA